MRELLARLWEHVIGRLSGPLHLRFIVQPAMAVILAIRFRRNEAPVLRAAWKDVGLVWTIAFALDAGYQLVMLRWFYPGEALLIASFLALLPYVVVRQSMMRLARRGRRS